MTPEQTKKLYKDFPDLYQQHSLSIQQSCMPWGCECGSGWFDIIYELSEKLSMIPGVQAYQVKEKYGTLRFYIDGGTKEAEHFIDEAEIRSKQTCEECGAPGKMNSNGWMSVRCKEHTK